MSKFNFMDNKSQAKMKVPVLNTPVLLNHILQAESHLQRGSASDHDEIEPVCLTLLKVSSQGEYVRKYSSASPTHHSSTQ